MSFKNVVSYLGCVAAWVILLPAFVVGAMALLVYAVFCELGESFVGGHAKTLDNSTARELARRMCLGH